MSFVIVFLFCVDHCVEFVLAMFSFAEEERDGDWTEGDEEVKGLYCGLGVW